MGVVHHASYLLYFEDARTGFLKAMGCDYAELEREGVGLAVRRTELRYIAPARYGDELTVRPSIERVGGASVRFGYEIVRQGERIATGMTELACIDLSTPERGVRMLPERLRGLMRG
jgi:acyl-CoA thioester hydrolase